MFAIDLNHVPCPWYKYIFRLGAGLEWGKLDVRACLTGPVYVLLAMFCLGASGSYALPPENAPTKTAYKSFDYGTYADTNDILMFVTNRGWLAHDRTSLLGRRSGLYYPRGSNKSMIFCSGLWIASKLGKGYRASVAEYDSDFSPGPMVNGSHLPDNEKFRVYKIARGDSPETNPDYAEWPYDQGVPALKDHEGNDSLDWSGRRIPRIIGDQTLWSVCNDANLANHISDPGGMQPMKLEVQCLSWSEDWPGSLSRTVFVHYTIINKGDSTLREPRFGIWADPDLGFADDDLVGCDSLLGLGYCYNGGSDRVYGDHPPAVGIVLLGGPATFSSGDSAWSISGQRFLSNRRPAAMSSFAAWTNGQDPSGESFAYYLLEGKDRTGLILDDPTTNTPTRFHFSGDPVNQTGWVNSQPGDWRLVVGTGKNLMPPGDTVEIVAAMVVGHGDESTNAITSMKQAAQNARNLWEGRFAGVTPAIVDILPGLCPNVVSFDEPIDLDFDFIRPAAAVPTTSITVALYGTSSFDAATADPQEIVLAGVPPSGWTREDVGHPDLRETPCGCAHSTRDGKVDLVLSFSRDKIAEAIQPLVEGAVRTLTFHATTRDGVRGTGRDCLTFVDVAGDSVPLNHLSGVNGSGLNGEFGLTNHPNPFNAATMITYSIATDGPVRLEIYDILGRRMKTLVDAWQRAGEYQILWDGVDIHGHDAGSGMYFYRLQSDDGVLSRKMILLK